MDSKQGKTVQSQQYIPLDKLELYKLSRELSKIAWKVYQQLNWQARKMMGDQFVESSDSVGSNIAEGYGRFHYLDRVRFYYNSRGSLLESRHWFELLTERHLIEQVNRQQDYLNVYKKIGPKINSLINSAMRAKNENS